MAREFDSASSEYLDVASDLGISGYPCTFTCWFYSPADTAAGQTLISINKGATDDFIRLAIQDNAAGNPLRAHYDTGSGNVFADVSGVTFAQWNHAALTLTSSDVQAWLNGTSGSNTHTLGTTTYTNTNIGRRSGAAPQYFDGSIAEVGIYNVELTSAEISSLAAGISPLKIRPQSLIFYVPCVRDDDEDLIGGLSLTANGTPTVSVHSRVYRPSPITIGLAAAAAPPAGNPWYYYANAG